MCVLPRAVFGPDAMYGAGQTFTRIFVIPLKIVDTNPPPAVSSLLRGRKLPSIFSVFCDERAVDNFG